jgi:hypothetical protein
MRWISKLQIPVYIFIWFLILPFPFKSGWSILGGYHILQGQESYTANTAGLTLSRIALIMVSLALGYSLYLITPSKNKK